MGYRNTGRSRTRRSHRDCRDKASKDRHNRSLDNRDNRRSQRTVRANRTRDRIQIRSRANRIHPNPSLYPNLDPSPCHSTRCLCRSLRTPYRNRRSLPENRHTLRRSLDRHNHREILHHQIRCESRPHRGSRRPHRESRLRPRRGRQSHVLEHRGTRPKPKTATKLY
jgi:hypothetical protein